MANKATVTITTPVVARTSFIDGAVTLRISVRTSLRKLADWSHHPRTLFPPLSSEPLAAMDLLVATFAIIPLSFLPTRPYVANFIPSNWQGRRDSNPQVRFWRPTV